MGRLIGIFIFFTSCIVPPSPCGAAESNGSPSSAKTTISGELRQWHKVTLNLSGPETSEDAPQNPFLHYRFQVTFQHPKTGLTYSVPGYFAADGNAANTSAKAGNQWRAHLSPDHSGRWTYQISFREGPGIAVSDEPDAGTPVQDVDGLRGEFVVEPSNKTGRDFRGKGRLRYVGKHHLQFAGDDDFFLKAGADAPENFLAYSGFDGDFKSDGHKDDLVKDWGPHVQDWQAGDPSWQDGKGKGIIGAINYLVSQGLNSFSFLTLNIDGDDRNVFPYTTYEERERMDCSRLDQWEIVLEHGTQNGMYLHFKTQEAENVNLLDGGHLGPQRKLYYRELIARFGHHLALNWNLGEEVGLGHKVSTEKKVAWADYFHQHDPYHHHIVIHNGNNHFDLLGDASALTGFSLQTNRADFRNVHGATLRYLQRSVEAGKPWVVACDEPGDASHSLIPDAENPNHDNARKNALWGNLMAGGAGVEWYFGYKHAHSDLTCQDYRVRENMWEQSRTALQFFDKHDIPFWEMSNQNDLLNNKNAYCLAKPGSLYLVYCKEEGLTTLDLSGIDGLFEVLWFNPREGGPLTTGTTQAIKAGKKVSIGAPPQEVDQDWLAIVRPGNPDKDYPPGISIVPPETLMLPQNGSSVSTRLAGSVQDDQTPMRDLQSRWSLVSSPGQVEFESIDQPDTRVTLSGTGKHVLMLSVNDGNQTSQSVVTMEVEPFQSKVTRTIPATEDAYLEGSKPINNQHLKVEGDRRVVYLQFHVENLPPKILNAEIQLRVSADGGNGKLTAYTGSHSDWKENELTSDSAPKPGDLIASLSVSAVPGEIVSIPVKKMLQGDGIYTVVLKLAKGGDDIWFESTSQGDGPTLCITYEDPDGKHDQVGQTKDGKRTGATILSALSDFEFVVSGEYVPGYRDANRRAMAINAARYQDKFAAAETVYGGPDGTFDLVLSTLTETDGESVYRLIVAGQTLGEIQNPVAKRDYELKNHRFSGIKLQRGDKIRVEFNSHSNGKIPEGDAFAYSRGRWRSVMILSPGASLK